MKAYGKANRVVDRPGPRRAAEAEAAGLAAFAFIARDAARTERFLRITGIAPEDLRAAAAEPGFPRAVLAYLMTDEALLLVFCEEERIDPARLCDLQAGLDAAERFADG